MQALRPVTTKSYWSLVTFREVFFEQSSQNPRELWREIMRMRDFALLFLFESVLVKKLYIPLYFQSKIRNFFPSRSIIPSSARFFSSRIMALRSTPRYSARVV